MWYFIATATTLKYSLATFGGAAAVSTVATYLVAKWRLRAAYILLVVLGVASVSLLARLLDWSFVVDVAEEHGWLLVGLVYVEIIFIGVGPAAVVSRQRRMNRT